MGVRVESVSSPTQVVETARSASLRISRPLVEKIHSITTKAKEVLPIALLSHNTEQIAARSQYCVTSTCAKRYLAALLRGSSFIGAQAALPVSTFIITRDPYLTAISAGTAILLFQGPASALGEAIEDRLPV